MSADKIPEPSRQTGPPVQSHILGRLLAKPTFQSMGEQGVLLADGWSAFRNKMQQWALLEQDMRRPFLFVPVAMMAGVLLYVKADREPFWPAPF